MPTFKGYVYNTTTSGLVFTSGEHWKIDADAFVGSRDTFGVVSIFSGSRLVNDGQVYSAESFGVAFTAPNSAIVNNAGASIFGHSGVFMQSGDHMDLTNHGSIKGFGPNGIGVMSFDTSHFVLDNDGDIYGHFAGVYLQATAGGFTGQRVANAGVIRSDQDGVFVNLFGSEKATVINEHGGVIEGNAASSYASVYVSFGRLSLENHGKLIGDVQITAADLSDRVVNDGTIRGNVYLGSGNDVYENAGGTARMVYGRDGNDKLIAGPHRDKFAFDAPLNTATNVDRVKHFEPGTDRLYLDQDIFTSLSGPGKLDSDEFHRGSRAADSDDFITYNPDNGAMYYDADGDGPGARMRFATFDTGLPLHNDDIVVMA